MESLFTYYVENETVHLKYARGEPSLKEREFHNYHEFVFYIGGEAYFISKNIQQALSPGSIVVIPKEQFHQFFVSDPVNYRRCILGFRETSETVEMIRRVMTGVKIISTPGRKIAELFEAMAETVKGELPDAMKCLFVQASLIQLLVYLLQSAPAGITENINISSVVQGAIAYIDEHYDQKLSVESIARQFYVSPSSLAHKFSRELNITVYQYILQKRMLSVQSLVEQGASYAEAAVRSGFSDYSCFYRLQKKYNKEKP